MRGPHPQSHVTLWSRGHVTNKKRYISTFTRAIDPKLSKGVDLGWGNLTYKVTWHINHVVTRQIENVISLPSQGLWSLNLAGSWIGWENLIYKVTWRSITWSRVKSKCFISTFTRPMSPKTWIRMKGSHPISHVTHPLCGHVKNQNRHISSTTRSSRCKRKACACQK